MRVAEHWADLLGGAWRSCTRPAILTSPTRLFLRLLWVTLRVKNLRAIDDMIDTGGQSIAGAVKVLMDKGAKEVIIAATHPVLPIRLLERSSQWESRGGRCDPTPCLCRKISSSIT